MLSGEFEPFTYRALIWSNGALIWPHVFIQQQSLDLNVPIQEAHVINILTFPAVLLSENGKRRHWGFVRQFCRSEAYQDRVNGLRDLQAIKNVPIAVTLVSASSGRILNQNTASMALHGEICVLTMISLTAI